MDLKCGICFFNFNLDSHCPKNLPCGHSICQECVQNPATGRKCPTCKKAFKQRRLEDLPDNFLAIQLLEDKDAPPCKKPKIEDPELEQLQRGADAGRKVVEVLRLVVPQAIESLKRQLESSVAQLGQVEEALERRVQREAAGDVGTTSDAVEEPLQLAEQLEASHRLLTSTKCTVAAEEEGGCAWTASVQPGGCGDILRVLLLQLRADGQLGKVDPGDHGGIDGPATPTAAYVGPPLFDIVTIDDEYLDNGRLKVDDIIRDVHQQWSTPRSVQNLKGDGSSDLLRVMGAHLEDLHISGLSEPSTMMEVEKLSSLKRLHIQCAQKIEYPDLPLQLEELNIGHISENQLRCVQRMDRLRSLQIVNYAGPNLTFPPSQHGRLLWLAVGFAKQCKPTMLSLISAHAASLQELEIACSLSAASGGSVNYFFPDLGQELAACGMRALRRLTLLRLANPQNECTGRVAECVLQRRTIRGLLAPSVEVLCRSCSKPQLEVM